jgi:capsular exopolysaccharide synthesis family protein
MKSQLTLRRSLGILIHWAWLILLVAVLAGIAGYVVSNRQTRIYEATTTILIEETANTSGQTDYNSILTSERRARTYAQLLTSTPLLEAVVKELGLSMNATALADRIVVQPVRDTQLIRVRVQDSDAERGASIANTLVQLFITQRQSVQSSRFAASKESLQQQIEVLNQQIAQTEARLQELGTDEQAQTERAQQETLLAQYRQSYGSLLQSFEQIRISEAQASANIVQEEPARAPGVLVSPRIMLTTVLAAILSVLVTVGLIFVRELVDDTVKDPQTLSATLGLPILGQLARIQREQATGSVVAAEPRSPVSESYRALRTNIEFASVDHPTRTLLVTSASPADGKSTTAVNLAAVMGQGGRQVVLVDADLRRPTLHKKLGLTNRAGLSDLFVQAKLQLDAVIRRTSLDNVSVITAGSLPPNPAELMGAQKMVDILAEIEKGTDTTIVDSPPITVVTDAAILAARVDGVILVVRSGKTRLAACSHALEQLQRGGAHVLGVVVNDMPLSRVGYGYGQSYYHYYGDQDDGKNNQSGMRRWLRRRFNGTLRVREQAPRTK